MPDSRDKRAIEIQDSIRQILFHDWDPIGVNSNPKLQDEYDSCIAPVYRILVGSRSEQELVELLDREAEGFLGAARGSAEDFDKLRPVARRLLELDVRL